MTKTMYLMMARTMMKTRSSSSNREIVDTLAHLHGPEGEEADSNDAQHDGSPRNVVVPGGGVVQPYIGIIVVKEDLIHVHLKTDLPSFLLLFLVFILLIISFTFLLLFIFIICIILFLLLFLFSYRNLLCPVEHVEPQQVGHVVNGLLSVVKF